MHVSVCVCVCDFIDVCFISFNLRLILLFSFMSWIHPFYFSAFVWHHKNNKEVQDAEKANSSVGLTRLSVVFFFLYLNIVFVTTLTSVDYFICFVHSLCWFYLHIIVRSISLPVPPLYSRAIHTILSCGFYLILVLFAHYSLYFYSLTLLLFDA